MTTKDCGNRFENQRQKNVRPRQLKSNKESKNRRMGKYRQNRSRRWPDVIKNKDKAQHEKTHTIAQVNMFSLKF